MGLSEIVSLLHAGRDDVLVLGLKWVHRDCRISWVFVHAVVTVGFGCWVGWEDILFADNLRSEVNQVLLRETSLGIDAISRRFGLQRLDFLSHLHVLLLIVNVLDLVKVDLVQHVRQVPDRLGLLHVLALELG